jgi:hypothetical protein
MMSANITAASTPCASTGWSVTSAQSSGRRQTSKSPCRFRISRYAGNERPACRMNHTGVRSTCSRRHARTRSGSDTVPTLARAIETVPEHPVPAGPLAVRWRGYALGELRAGALGSARLALENAGSAAWPPEGPHRVCVSYHWLDELGNPIVWDGLWTALPHRVDPGGAVEAKLAVRAPMPPGRYRLAFDLVADDRLWLTEVGNNALEREVDVAPRISARALAVRGADPGALDLLEEPVVGEDEATAIAHLAPGCVPDPEWSRRILDAHEEGFAAVGGAVDAAAGLLRRMPAELAPWAPGPGRVPGFTHPLLCPSLVREIEPRWLAPVCGLPALDQPAEEPWLYDGRIVVRARLGGLTRRRGAIGGSRQGRREHS